MITFNRTTDATRAYRETSGVKTIRMDRTGDTGSLLEVMRDAVLVIGTPTDDPSFGKIPEHPWGNVDAYSIG
jgi:hypothetical protein